ncbi:MAG TPA: FGGY-family carbohydrate kinase, partial [Candidatus Limnocylindrales bacterium]|nr:FGGY-family carbohydrate kinase [Candidatus Limnocylindrales bacterium]
GPSCVPAADDGRAVGEAIAWSDTRAASEAAELEAATGLGAWQLAILPAALWVERQDPARASATRWYLNSWEWLAFRLSGEARRTRSAGQILADPESIVAEGLDAAKTPPTVDAGTVIEGLTDESAATLGLARGTPVVAGLNDAFAACLGVGLLEAGDAYDAGGSAGGFAVYADRPIGVEGAFGGAAPVEDRWFVGGVTSATGRALDWLAAATGTTAATLLDEAAVVPAGADGLVFLPYLAGERSPIWDPRARGAFVGLTLRHGRPELARAVLESAALAIRHVAAPILAAGVDVREMRVAGRPAGSETWNRIKADVTRFPVAVPEVVEAALLGSAILGAVGVGRQPDVRAAIGAMVRIASRIDPDATNQPTYDALFDVYRSLHGRLDEASHALGALP